MSAHDDEDFGVQYSEGSVFDICLDVAEKLQAFHITGKTSKRPYDMELEEFVQKVIDGEL